MERILYPIAERFKAPQGEGLYTGTPMAFIRFVGCSVGKKVCHACDTDFEKILPELGGGKFTADALLAWADNYNHICLTGGEPMDRDLDPFLDLCSSKRVVHIETSGTKIRSFRGGRIVPEMWICVSPKPGFIEEEVMAADEIKVIIGGLGDGKGWPIIGDALRWARLGKLVYIQPRNAKHVIDSMRMQEAVDLVATYPELRLSAQLHKYISTR